MYNRQLDTFLCVVDRGSFSKAAKILYITPSAVTQQINSLEETLGVELFIRTTHGVTLTEAGAYLAQEAPVLIQHNEEIREKLTLLHVRAKGTISIAIGILHTCRMFYRLWARFEGAEKDYHVQTLDLRTDLHKADMVEGLKYNAGWQKEFDFLPVCDMPVACAVSRSHPLSTKKVLTFADLQPYTLAMIHHDISDSLGSFYEDACDQGIKIMEVNRYEHSVFTMCAFNQYVLQTHPCWKDIHPELVTIPCDWHYSLPYGLFYHQHPSPVVQEFLGFVRKELQDASDI